MTESSDGSDSSKGRTRVKASSHGETICDIVCKVSEQIEVGREFQRGVDLWYRGRWGLIFKGDSLVVVLGSGLQT